MPRQVCLDYIASGVFRLAIVLVYDLSGTAWCPGLGDEAFQRACRRAWNASNIFKALAMGLISAPRPRARPAHCRPAAPSWSRALDCPIGRYLAIVQRCELQRKQVRTLGRHSVAAGCPAQPPVQPGNGVRCRPMRILSPGRDPVGGPGHLMS
jgi:hypothetical protein